MSTSINVLFVCLGNICRSPTAHGIFQSMVDSHPSAHSIYVDSAGTGDWHIGAPPDSRAVSAAKQRGCDISGLRARQVTRQDFDQFDYILAMDAQNLLDLRAICPGNFKGTLCRFLDFADMQADVPDPYFGGSEGFEHVFDLCQSASRGLLAHISRHHV